MTTTDTATTIDFGPLLELRAEYDPIGDDLCRRIDADDPVAADIGRQTLDRELAIMHGIEARLNDFYRPGWNTERGDEITVADALLAIVMTVDATGDLHMHIDDATHRREQEALVDAREQILLVLDRPTIRPFVIDLVLASFDKWLEVDPQVAPV